MKTSKKKWVIIIAAICAVLLIGGYFGFQILFGANFHPIETMKLSNGIYSIRSGISNMYLVEAGEGFVAIDAGSGVEVVKSGLNKLGIAPEKVTAMFLTHSDYDHVASIKAFPNAKVYLSTEEEQMINGTTMRSKGSYNHLDCAYELVADNQVIDMSGLSIKGIMTPGHTPGSMCYLIDGKYLFTGDILSLQKEKVGLSFKKYNMDEETQAESIRKLAGLSDISTIFTAHYGYTENYEEAMSSWR